MIGFGRCLGFGIIRLSTFWLMAFARLFLFFGLLGGSGWLRAEWGQDDSSRLLGIYRDVESIKLNLPNHYNELENISALLGDLHGFQSGPGWLAGIYQGLFSGDGTTFQGQVHSDLTTVISRLNALQTFLSGTSGSSSVSFQLSQTQSGSKDGDWDSLSGTNMTDFFRVSTLNQALQTNLAALSHQELINKLGFEGDLTLYSMLNDIKNLLGGGSSSGGETDLGFPYLFGYGVAPISSGGWFNYQGQGYYNPNSPSASSLAVALGKMNDSLVVSALNLGWNQQLQTENELLALLGASDLGGSSFQGYNMLVGSWQNIMGEPDRFNWMTGSSGKKVKNLLEALSYLNQNLRLGLQAIGQNQYILWKDLDASLFNAADYIVTNLVDMLPSYWGSPDSVDEWDKGTFPTVSDNGTIAIQVSAAAGSTAVVTADITPVTTNDFVFLSELVKTNSVGRLDYSSIKDRYVGEIWQMTYSAPTGGTAGGDTVLVFGDGMEFNVGDAYDAFKEGVWGTAGPVIKSMFDYLWLALSCLSAFMISRKVVSGGV